MRVTGCATSTSTITSNMISRLVILSGLLFSHQLHLAVAQDTNGDKQTPFIDTDGSIDRISDTYNSISNNNSSYSSSSSKLRMLEPEQLEQLEQQEQPEEEKEEEEGEDLEVGDSNYSPVSS